MIPVRVIPCLLLKNRGLVKTVRFKDPTYVGDPINAVKIFNDKLVDELVFVDISATPLKTEPPFELLKQISSECFMPFAYGGGVTKLGHFHSLFALGVEKVCVNTHAVRNPGFLAAAAQEFGSQSIVAAIDVKKKLIGGYEARTDGGRAGAGISPVELARRFEQEGAGEIFLNDIDRDGTMSGYNLDLIKSVTDAVGIPVVACGGARNVQDLSAAIIQGGASAAAAGSMFVFMGKHRAVLINYPVPAGNSFAEGTIQSRH
jgi:cyclase